MNRRFLDVLKQEWRQRSQETVSTGLAIHVLDNQLRGELISIEELLCQVGWQLALEHIAHKALAQNGTTTLVAKNVAKRRHIVDNLLAIVVARV